MITSIIVAGGNGNRIGLRKQFIKIELNSLFIRILKTFYHFSKIDLIYVVVPSHYDYSYLKRKIRELNFFHRIKIIQGGNSRQESVLKALKVININTNLVIIHDSNRPFVSKKLITKSIFGSLQTGACIPIIPICDSIVEINKMNLKFSRRKKKWLIQTPQAFDFELILRAHILAKKNKYYANDDSSIAAHFGALINVIKGNIFNIKITKRDDLILAKAINDLLKNKSELDIKGIK